LVIERLGIQDVARKIEKELYYKRFKENSDRLQFNSCPARFEVFTPAEN
jgi:hypothetical protein